MPKTFDQDKQSSKFDITVGVITYAARFKYLLDFMELLKAPIQEYQELSGMSVEFLLVNNSGRSEALEIESLFESSSLHQVCESRLLHSTQNNIATGRNLVLTNCKFSHIAFIDDDEIPDASWLMELSGVMLDTSCAVVSGPVFPQFPANTSDTVKNIDLHNTSGRRTGDELPFTATCNVLLDTQKISDIRFDESYGRSGGSDTEFFLRVTDSSAKIVWAADAILFETIPASRSTLKYMIRRAVSQGSNYRRIKSERGEIKSPFLFSLKAIMVAVVSLLIGTVLTLIKNKKAGNWLKRAFANIGFLVKPSKQLYD